MTKKNILTLMLSLFCVSLLFGQSIDEERMERDLKIAENILGTLSGSESRNRLFNNIESNYIPDYGVIFSIAQSSFIYAQTVSGNVLYSTNSSSGSTYVISDNNGKGDETAVVGIAKKEESDKEKLVEEAAEEKKKQITVFLVDYADLIGQLKPADRITVQVQSRNDRFFPRAVSNKKKSNAGLTASMLKSELIAYKQGKITREEAIENIVFSSNDTETVAKDVELFATIFARLYEPDLSSTYYVPSRNIGYTKLDGFGVTFNMKVYSSSSDNGLHTIRTTGESDLSYEERNAKINAMYPEFEMSFKENLVDYGRTIKSLKDNEMLMFKVKLTECKGCEMPDEIEVSVSGKTLQDYDKGSISKENAMKQITVKRR